MKETLKRELNRTYLILSNEEVPYEESYEVEMIIKNEPQKILPLHVLRVDGCMQLFYDVSAKQTLKDCAQRNKLSSETIYKLFEAIEQLMSEVKDYLLDMECVVLDLEHIYTQEGTFYFCYCPWERREVLFAFQKMLEEILGNLDYHDTEGVEVAYHLYQSACKGDFDIAEILAEHCKNKTIGTEEMYENYFSEQEKYIEQSELESKITDESKGIIRRFLRLFIKKEKEKPEDEKSRCYSAGFEREWNECKVAEELHYMERNKCMEGNTMLLGSMSTGRWKLRPLLSDYEEFCITGDNFLVGKKKKNVDGYIERNTISRIHSRLFVKDGSLFIADANSTNGTFVNGEAIGPGKEVEIFAGDRILFADVEYECYNSL